MITTGCVDLSLPRELERGGPIDASIIGPIEGLDAAIDGPIEGLDAAIDQAEPIDLTFDPQSMPDTRLIDTPSISSAPPIDGPPAVVPRPVGLRCSTGTDCESGSCVDGVCCGSACAAPCHACNVPGSEGMCLPVPAGQDPAAECEQDPSATCGRDGACDGMGGCRRYPVNTVACATTCTSNSQCAAGLTCVASACQMVAPPALHWKLDEEMGTMALDASPAALHGTYTGENGAPTPSPTVPTLRFPDPLSRTFVKGSRHAIQLATMPASLKPANNLTVSLWFRATEIDTRGAELLSGGNQYLLRVGQDTLRFSRRVVGSNTSIQCDGTSITGHLDGQWHHLAGVQSPVGMKLYFDGVERCTNTRGEDIRYDAEPSLWVGRHATSGSYDFEGNLDDVRIYTRSLTADEIKALFMGAP